MIPWKSLRLLPFPGLLTVKTVKQARRKAVAKILLWRERDLSKMRSLVDCASVKVLLLLRATLQTGVDSSIPHGLVVRIRRSHRRGPGSIPGVATVLTCLIVSVVWWSSRLLYTQKVVSSILTGNRRVFDKSKIY